MRIVSLGIAAMTLATASFATPALAQYGGSPDQQLDGPPPAAVAGKPGLADLQAELEAEPRGGPYDQVDPSAPGGPQDLYDPALQGGPQDQYDPAAGDPAAAQYGPPDQYYGPNGPGDADNDADNDAEEYAQVGPDDQAGPDYENQDLPVYGAGEGGQEGPPPPPAEGTYCRRSDGTTGMLVGGGAGALIGSSIDGHGGHGGHRGHGRYGGYGGHGGHHHGGSGVGAIIGAFLGAVIGGAVERSTCR